MQVWLTAAPIHFDTQAELIEYIITPYLRPATGLPEMGLQRLAGSVAARLGERIIHYVRSNIEARRT